MAIIVALTFALLGMFDLLLSLAAFSLEVAEANLAIAWFFARNLFVPFKMFFTGLVSVVCLFWYSHRQVKIAMWVAILFMFSVDLFHIWGIGVCLTLP